MFGWFKIFIILTSLKSWGTDNMLAWLIYGPHHVYPTSHSSVGWNIQDEALGLGRKSCSDCLTFCRLVGFNWVLSMILIATCKKSKKTFFFDSDLLSTLLTQTYAIWSHLSSSQDMASQLDFGEVALPNGLEQTVVPNMGCLFCCGWRGLTAGQAHRVGHLTTAIIGGGMLGKPKSDTQLTGREDMPRKIVTS